MTQFGGLIICMNATRLSARQTTLNHIAKSNHFLICSMAIPTGFVFVRA